MPKVKKKTAKRVKPTKSKPAKKTGTAKSVVTRIKEVVVPPATKGEPVLVTPLPQKEVRNFGAMPFDAQARLVFQTLPADAAEIVGTTENSGAGSVSVPPVAGQ